MGSVYAYCRVSSPDQNEECQLICMRELQVPKENIFVDKQSGKDFNRPQYKKLIRRIKADDLIYIKSIDRLGRNYSDILEQWKIITKDKKADLYVIDMPIIDTRREKNLLGEFISDLVLVLLSYVAENERTIIRQRKAEGIAAAKARGVHFGRIPIPLPKNFFDVYQRWKMKKITVTEAASECEMPVSTLFGKAKKYEISTFTK